MEINAVCVKPFTRSAASQWDGKPVATARFIVTQNSAPRFPAGLSLAN